MRSIQYLMPALALVVLLPIAATAAVSEVISLDGAYVLDVKASDDIKAAVNVAVADVTFLWRGFARKGGLESNPAYPRIVITHSTNEVVVTLGDKRPMHMPIDGTGAKWQREDGKLLDTNCQWRSTALLQTIKNNDWRRDNDFSLSTDGTLLTLKAHFAHKRLDKPIEYRLVYRRETK